MLRNGGKLKSVKKGAFKVFSYNYVRIGILRHKWPILNASSRENWSRPSRTRGTTHNESIVYFDHVGKKL